MDNQKTRYNLLLNSVPATAFGKYQMDSAYAGIRKLLNDRKYRAGDTRVSARVIFHWGRNKLIPDGAKINSDSWRKFSLVEMVWLRTVLHLRDFGLSLPRIYNVKRDILHWMQKTECYPYFEFCVAQALDGADIYVVVSANGAARLLFKEEIEMGKIFGYYSHVLLISLRSILSEFKQDISETKNWFGLSNNEMGMVTEIRKGGNKEVRARVRGSNLELKKVVEIENTETYPENPSVRGIQKQLEREGAFAEMIISLEHGKEQSVEVIKKRKRS